MECRPVVEADKNNFDSVRPQRIVEMQAPRDMENCSPCSALMTWDHDMHVVRVPWKLDDNDIQTLIYGGTLWFSSWGGLPPHALVVLP